MRDAYAGLSTLGQRPGLAMLLLFAGLAGSCRAPHVAEDAVPRERFEYTQPQMGVPFRIVLYARDRAEAEQAAEAAYTRLRELNAIMSDYEDDSELTLLSRTAGSGRWVPVSPDLWKVLERGQAMAAATGGAFDVTVGPLVQLWRRARRQRELPDPARLAAARAAVGYRHLELDRKRRQARLRVPGMRLDLGSIGKGYGADEALATLRRLGIRSALVAGSGDMAFSDPPPGRPGWRIEVAPLDVTNAPPARFVVLANCGIATSGDVFQHVEIAGRRYSHIVDPRTGVGLTDHSLVTVIARDCLTANSLSTSISVLGPKLGLPLVARTPGAAAYVARRPADRIEITESKRFRQCEAQDGERP